MLGFALNLAQTRKFYFTLILICNWGVNNGADPFDVTQGQSSTGVYAEQSRSIDKICGSASIKQLIQFSYFASLSFQNDLLKSRSLAKYKRSLTNGKQPIWRTADVPGKLDLLWVRSSNNRASIPARWHPADILQGLPQKEKGAPTIVSKVLTNNQRTTETPPIGGFSYLCNVPYARALNLLYH